MGDYSVIDQFLHDLNPRGSDNAPTRRAPDPVERLSRPFAGVALAIWLLILSIGSLTYVILRFDSVQNAYRAAYDMARSVKDLKGDMLDVETGQRGYVITHDASFLEPYIAGTSRVQGSLENLRTALAAQPALLASLDRVSAHWGDKVAVMQRTIADVRDDRQADAVQLVVSGVGKGLMDAIRADLDAIDAKSASQIDLAVADFELWRLLLVGLGILALAAAVLASWWEIARTRRFLGASVAYQAGILESNQTLEQAVDRRTESLGQISALLQAVMGATGEAIYAKDRKSRMIFANDSTLKVIGLSRSQILGRSDIEFHTDRAQAEEAMRNDRRVMETGVGETVEEVYTSGDTRRIFSSTKRPLKSGTGEIMGVVGVSADITERKSAEAALYLSEQRFRAAISAFDGIVWTANPAGEVVLANAAWTALTGQTMTQAAGSGWSQRLHPDDIEPTRLKWSACLVEKRPFIGEYRVRALDEGYHTFAVRAVPVRDAMNTVTEWVGLNIDITSERDAQQKLRESVERFNIALAAGNTGAWELMSGPPKQSIYDARMLEIWGLPPGSDRSAFLAAIHPDDRSLARSAVDRLFLEGSSEPLDLEYRIIDPHGQIKWVAIRGKMVVKYNGETSIIGTARDISERRRQEERIGFLMRELSHRTKNSLAIVQAIARQTGARASSMDEFQSAFQQRLHAMAQSLNLIAENDWRPVGIFELIRSQISHHSEPDIERIVLHGPEIYLKTEAAQNIGLALHELSTNAAKYGALSTSNGTVSLQWSLGADANGAETFSMIWQESDGPIVVAPQVKGFGHTVIQRVVKAALAGESNLQFHHDGVRWDLAIPARHVVAASAAVV